MTGKAVIVKVFTGDLVVRKVWTVGQNVVHVTDEINYNLLKTNGPAVVPIGVPNADVFEYDSRFESEDFERSQLKRWKPLL